MNEPPGARARVALTGLTVAEYFRDAEGQDVLLFIDNIFRFVLLLRKVYSQCFSYIFLFREPRPQNPRHVYHNDNKYLHFSWSSFILAIHN